MKSVVMTVMMLASVAISGCASSSTSSQGGSASKDEGFRIIVLSSDTNIKQGESQSVAISLEREDYFKQDVTLHITPSKGLYVEPMTVLVRAGDRPDVQFRIAAAMDAAIGEYKVNVAGTPSTGKATSIDFKVMVVSP